MSFLEKLDARLTRIEQKLDALQPLLDEYNASQIMWKKITKVAKISALFIGIVISSLSIWDRLQKRDLAQWLTNKISR